MATNGMTWDQLVQQAQAAQKVYQSDAMSGRGEYNDFDPNSLIDWNGSKALLHLPNAPTTTWNGEADPNFNQWNNAHLSFSDPTDDDYYFKLMRGADGSVQQTRHKDVSDITFAAEMGKFIANSMGMYGVGNFVANVAANGLSSAASSAASNIAGDAAAGAASSAGSTAASGAADFLTSIGISPESISAFTPASGADFASMGIGDLAGSGAATATSGGGLAGGSASGGGGIAVDGVNQFANEAAKLAAQNSAAPGSLVNTTLPTIATTAGGGMWEGLLGKAIDFGTSKIGSSLIGAGISALGSKNAPNSTTQTSTTQLDPRMQAMLYGDGTAANSGLMGQIMANQNRPQNAGTQQFGNAMDNYLKNWGEQNFAQSQAAAQRLQGSNISAPTMEAAQVAAAQINAPSQNNLNLSPAYQDMIYGEAGNNPYLTGAIQKGINQSTNAFGNYVADSTKAVQDQLTGIRGGAVLNNTMGSSRQGIAEGRALSDFGQNLTRAASQFGQNNTDAAVAAQAGAYDQDRNRALSAMSGLGAQQYGVAQQNAAMQQQANMANASFWQQAQQANQGAQLSTNQLNSQNQTAGIGLSSGLLGQAAGYGQQQDQYAGNKLGQTAGLLSNFTGYGATQSTTSPLYQNTAGNVLGGALAGASLWNAFNPTQKQA